jgi:hypothetical protein
MGDMERKRVDFCFFDYLIFKNFCFVIDFIFFGTLSGIFWFFTCYDGAPLRPPVLEKGVMLGVLPKQR